MSRMLSEFVLYVRVMCEICLIGTKLSRTNSQFPRGLLLAWAAVEAQFFFSLCQVSAPAVLYNDRCCTAKRVKMTKLSA